MHAAQDVIWPDSVRDSQHVVGSFFLRAAVLYSFSHWFVSVPWPRIWLKRLLPLQQIICAKPCQEDDVLTVFSCDDFFTVFVSLHGLQAYQLRSLCSVSTGLIYHFLIYISSSTYYSVHWRWHEWFVKHKDLVFVQRWHSSNVQSVNCKYI